MVDTFKEAKGYLSEAKDRILTLQDTYVDLINQRDNVKSNTLKEILNAEIYEYTCLTEVFTKFMQIYFQYIEENEKNNHEFLYSSIEKIKTVNNVTIEQEMLERAKNTYNIVQTANDIDVIVANFSIENYILAIDRNFKEWDNFAKMLGSKIADIALDAIPGISEMKNLFGNIKDVAELMNEFEKNATDYSEVDKKLFEIEQHIILMKLSKELIEQSVKILEKR